MFRWFLRQIQKGERNLPLCNCNFYANPVKIDQFLCRGWIWASDEPSWSLMTLITLETDHNLTHFWPNSHLVRTNFIHIQNKVIVHKKQPNTQKIAIIPFVFFSFIFIYIQILYVTKYNNDIFDFCFRCILFYHSIQYESETFTNISLASLWCIIFLLALNEDSFFSVFFVQNLVKMYSNVNSIEIWAT